MRSPKYRVAVGICRLAFSVDDIDDTYERLQAIGVEFMTSLQRLKTPLMAMTWRWCVARILMGYILRSSAD
ncbi:VOC family protein [Rhizorhapis sp.]|uniref:VOC family protein n=1 Tax=Rhizorhapis sp. TaxID=1968842 RepID=UPI0039C91391